ncbi:glycosyltransferase [Helicobacter sp. 23-1045]
MQILLTINDISITGGAERVCVNLANALAESGHNVEILSFYRAHKSLPYAIKTKCSFEYECDENSMRDRFCKNPLLKLYFKNFHKIFISFKIWMRYKHADMIITNDWTYAPFFRRKRTKYLKLHHLRFAKYNKRNDMFDTLIILSKNELSIWQKYHKNVFVIPNFLPQIPQKSTDSAQKVVLSVGRMDNGDQKGFLRLIDIWGMVQSYCHTSHTFCHSECSEESQKSTNRDSSFSTKTQNDKDNLTKWKLVLVGDGVLKSEIQSKIKSLNLQDSIILKPFTKEIEREYLGASIYAMASHFEGFPMVLVEASSYALPCIAFDIATGPSDIIAHNKSGYLVSDNDLEAYAKHLIKLMSDESKRIAFGGEAKRLVGERFSKEVVMEKWEELLRKIAESSEKIH